MPAPLHPKLKEYVKHYYSQGITKTPMAKILTDLLKIPVSINVIQKIITRNGYKKGEIKVKHLTLTK